MSINIKRFSCYIAELEKQLPNWIWGKILCLKIKKYLHSKNKTKTNDIHIYIKGSLVMWNCGCFYAYLFLFFCILKLFWFEILLLK